MLAVWQAPCWALAMQSGAQAFHLLGQSQRIRRKEQSHKSVSGGEEKQRWDGRGLVGEGEETTLDGSWKAFLRRWHLCGDWNETQAKSIPGRKHRRCVVSE